MKISMEAVEVRLRLEGTTELTEIQLERAARELRFQLAMAGSRGASLTVRGARKQHLITLRHKQRALMAQMARVMLIDEVEDQARRRMDAWVEEVDERSDS
jgi:hypothetical protein